MKIIPVNTVDEVLQHALTRQPEAIEWVEVEAERVSTGGAQGTPEPAQLPN